MSRPVEQGEVRMEECAGIKVSLRTRRQMSRAAPHNAKMVQYQPQPSPLLFRSEGTGLALKDPLE